MFCRKKAIALAAALFLIAGGCGLREYEDRLVQQQDRLDYIEKENKNLGAPVKFKARKEVKEGQTTKPAPNIFLRLPKGIPVEGAEAFPGSLLYCFNKDSSKPEGVDEVCIAGGKEEQFEKDVLAEIQKTRKLGEPRRQEDKLPPPLDQEPLRFTAYSAIDGKTPKSSYLIYFYENAGYHVAIVYRQQPATDDSGKIAFDPRIDYSLKSLAVGAAAVQKRSQYRAP
ncbi:MAG TPA: hypothetical protein VG013_03825 [Gemmataceae bacterium]|jgi:hypothetical protein|nr:hypothetical protein [Gemmataceae bacterium]